MARLVPSALHSPGCLRTNDAAEIAGSSRWRQQHMPLPLHGSSSDKTMGGPLFLLPSILTIEGGCCVLAAVSLLHRWLLCRRAVWGINGNGRSFLCSRSSSSNKTRKSRCNRIFLHAGKRRMLLDDLDNDGDDDDDFTAFTAGMGDSKKKQSKKVLDTFQAGATFKQAKFFGSVRTFAVAPWSADVKPKPILAASDNTGAAATKLAQVAFLQFGCSERANIEVMSDIRTEEDVCEVVAKAASKAPADALVIEKSGAMIVYTVADKELSTFFEEECDRRGVQSLNVLEPVLEVMERHFGLRRSLFSVDDEQALLGFEAEGATIFTVSDSSGDSTKELVMAALRQFPGAGVDTINICPGVRSLEEVNCIVQEAEATESLVIFSFASPGMSRFMRQQCERAKVLYADVYQPVLIAFEKYLDYPPVGVPGGHDLQDDNSFFARWQQVRVQH